MIKTLLAFCFVAIPCCQLAAKTVPGITVVYETKKKAVNIKWQQTAPGIKSFVIQRSADNANWADIARQESVNFNANKMYQFYDYKSTTGQNYYRLKCITEKGQTEYSASIMVVTGGTGYNWVMYPVPVGDVLTLQYKGGTKITGVINIVIQNMYGKILTRVRSASLNTVIKIPVDNLGKGIYDIRIMVEGEIIWNQRFVK
jgi:Secretion system C-terminal sorting domain